MKKTLFILTSVLLLWAVVETVIAGVHEYQRELTMGGTNIRQGANW